MPEHSAPFSPVSSGPAAAALAPDHDVVVSSDEAWRAFEDETSRVPPRRTRPKADGTSTPSVERLAFDGESLIARLARRGIGQPPLWALAILAGLLVGVAVYTLGNPYEEAGPSTRAPLTGAATIDSRPDGLEVVIDDRVRGTTPLKVALPPGNHRLLIKSGTGSRSIPLVIEAGTSVAQYFDLGAASPSAVTGGLEVTSEPSGAGVSVDGVAIGITPLSLPTVTTGEHQVVVGTGDAAVARKVAILSGATASIAASLGRQPSRSGWVAIKAPFEMQILEGGLVIGTTEMDRVMLPTGLHQLELVHTPSDYRTTASVQVLGGRVASQVVTVPNGSLSVNALPWADVAIDGRPVGTTPLANISLPVGSHEIVLTHPQQGERRRTIVVSANAATRIGVDFGQQ